MATSAFTLLALAVATPVAALSTLSRSAAPRIDDTWVNFRSMLTPRANVSLATLKDGRVMAAGGTDGASTLSSVEIYDPRPAEWIPAGSMDTKRQSFGLTTLRNGDVLACGGYDPAAAVQFLTSCETFDFDALAWKSAASMTLARADFGIATIPNGNVVIAGGYEWHTDTALRITKVASMYDPGRNSWVDIAPMKIARARLSLTVMLNGDVLAVGGVSTLLVDGPVASLDSTEVYRFASAAWSPSTTMLDTRSSFGLVTLANGSIIVAGGLGGTSSASTYSTCLVLHANANAWERSQVLRSARGSLGMTVLINGSVLAAGGKTSTSSSSAPIATANLLKLPLVPPSPVPVGNYRCKQDACVDSGVDTGVPLEECDRFCGDGKYLCDGGRCNPVTEGGVSLAECVSICRPPAPFFLD
eukprot:m.188255 g.188255  ORF g.188255 m.188255 type:complete len:416 (-) comp32335_c1_seq1:94-1341(-)